MSHFLREQDDGRHVIAVTELPGLLRKQFSAQQIEVYDRKSAYLARLYAALRGRRDALSTREAKNAARTFANFMAYKPVKSIDQFCCRGSAGAARVWRHHQTHTRVAAHRTRHGAKRRACVRRWNCCH
ncbi:hypothetical protein UMZ34_11965 [Halopseudomonas pachastrellae]|nr:hypothetical protein UMZ34_11965 [Halopseudomonas pachastrellae]